jgi:carbamoyl-phosphate synthase small subunit
MDNLVINMQGLKKARLVLEDGTIFEGTSFGHEEPVAGEVVFYTAMTGYPESLTDPSYKGQILVPTYPMIGNYGVPADDERDGISMFFESARIHCSALVISDYSERYSHWNSRCSLGEWLRRERVPGIHGVDTRALARRLRERGTMMGKVLFDGDDVPFHDPNKDNLVALVSTTSVVEHGNGKYKVILVDCGVKNNILRCLLARDTRVRRVPWDYDFTNEPCDGIFLSNGPGDPARCEATIEHVRRMLDRDTPVMGICLGNQIMARAAGATTYKLKYGHRSHNQPVIRPGHSRCYITSQNHGFAIDERTLPPAWEPLFVNVNDGTNEGIRHATKPFFSAQFHPEAASGPVDTEFLFDDFIAAMAAARDNTCNTTAR